MLYFNYIVHFCAQLRNERLRKMKKFLSIILAFTMMLGVFVMPAFAETAADDEIVKILLIGGSFGRDTADDMGYLLKGYKGENFLVGRLAKANTTLKDHYTYCSTGGEVYTYYETTSSQPTADYNQNIVSGIKTAEAACERHEWDYVILHTTAIDCGLASKFVDEENTSYVDLFVKFMKTIEPNAKYVWNTTWQAPETVVNGNSVMSGLKENFGGDSLLMYKSVSDCVKTYAEPYVDMVLPAHSVLQNLEGLGVAEDQIYRDHTHLNLTNGCYAVGLLTVCKLLGATPEEVASTYRNDSITDEMFAAIKKAVACAIAEPYKSYTTAKKIISEQIYNYRPTALEGKSEAEFKTLLIEKLAPMVLNTGVALSVENLTINDYKTDASFSFTYKFTDEILTEELPVVVSSAFTITPSVASESEIDAVSELKFTFNMEMKEETINKTNILLYEEVKSSTAPTWSERVHKGEYSAENKTYTVKFNEGDIAPGQRYKIEFSNAIESESGVTMDEAASFIYKVKWGEYYINENFSRFKTGSQLNTNNSDQKSLIPFQYRYQTFGGSCVRPKIMEENGKKYMYASASRAGAVSYEWGYRQEYLPEYNQRTYFTEYELDFKIEGTGNDYYYVWTNYLMVKKDTTDGKYYLWYATGSPSVSAGSGNAATYFANSYTKVGNIEIPQGEEIKLKLIVYRVKYKSSSRAAYIYRMELERTVEGVKKTEVADFSANPLTTTKVTSSHFFDNIGSYQGTYQFAVGARPVSYTDEEGKTVTPTETAKMWIYSIKCKPYDALKLTEPLNEAKNVPVDADAVLTFDTDMDEESLKNITVEWVDMLTDVTYQGTYDKTNKTYTLDFDETPAYRTTYRIIFPTTLKTASGHNIEVDEKLSFMFEDRVTKFDEGDGSVSGKTFNKLARIENPNPGQVVLATYAGGKLLGADVVEITTAEDIIKDVPLSVTADDIADENKAITYKIMYFKSFDNIYPYFDAIDGNVRN